MPLPWYVPLRSNALHDGFEAGQIYQGFGGRNDQRHHMQHRLVLLVTTHTHPTICGREVHICMVTPSMTLYYARQIGSSHAEPTPCLVKVAVVSGPLPSDSMPELNRKVVVYVDLHLTRS